MIEHAVPEIMVAEDNAADVALVREALEEYAVPCNLHVMRDGAAAIAFLDELDRRATAGRLDLVLVDMHRLAEFMQLGGIIRSILTRSAGGSEPETDEPRGEREI